MAQMPDYEIGGRQTRRRRRSDAPDAVDLSRIGIDSEYVRATAHEVLGVAPITAAGVEDPHLGGDTAAEKLVEQVDVDATELGDQPIGTTGWIGRHLTYEADAGTEPRRSYKFSHGPSRFTTLGRDAAVTFLEA